MVSEQEKRVFFGQRAIVLSGATGYYRFLKRRRHFFKKVTLFFSFLTDSRSSILSSFFPIHLKYRIFVSSFGYCPENF